MDKKQFELIRKSISSFCKINFFQISLETKQATGLFCSSHSFIAKDSALERLKSVIEELKYPFTVSEDGLTNTNHFIIRF